MAKVLIVDNDNSFTSSATDELSKSGMDVSTASTIEDALKNIESSSYDIILLDVSLKDAEDGF